MRLNIAEVDTSLSPGNCIERVVSFMGYLDDWEKEIIQSPVDIFGDPNDFGSACLHIASNQTTSERTIKWLQLGTKSGDERVIVSYASFLYGSNSYLNYKGDEAALWLASRSKRRLRNFDNFDPFDVRARRFFTHSLLLGSLSKNQNTSLYRSFFHSGMREVYLLPLISKYIVSVDEKKKKRDIPDNIVTSSIAVISSLLRMSEIVFNDTSFINSLTLIIKPNNQFLFCLLPLLLSHIPNVKELKFQRAFGAPKLSLSFLQQADTSKLTLLDFEKCSYDSLSPLSVCDLTSLQGLCIRQFPRVEGLHPLNGLSSDITRSLKSLEVSVSYLKDLSPLSYCDLSSLEELRLLWNTYLSDISALRQSDCSSLTTLSLEGSTVSDISPLCDCKGLALHKINISRSAIEDLSPLSLLDLSRLERPINLSETKVSDLSPLENISYDGVEVDISGTPAAKEMKKEGLESPQMIGKVKVMW